MSVITGILATANSDTVYDNVGEWQSGIIVKQARGVNNSGAILFALLATLPTEDADSYNFNWFERAPIRRTVYSSSAEANVAATTLNFDDGAAGNVFGFLTAGVVLENRRTGEYVQVTANATTGAASVSRGFASTVAAAVLENDIWLIVTASSGEGSTARRAVYVTPDIRQNYIQEFKSTSDITRLLAGSRVRTTENQRIQHQAYALEQVSNDIELAFFSGRKGISTIGGETHYLTGGIRDGLVTGGLSASHILEGGGSSGVSLPTLLNWVKEFIIFGSPNKLLFSGPTAFAALSMYANATAGGFRIMNMANEFGMQLHRLVTPFGSCDLVMHPIFANEASMHTDMFAVDLGNIRQKIMQPLVLEEDVQTPSATKMTDQYIACLGIKMQIAEAFGYARNLQTITSGS